MDVSGPEYSARRDVLCDLERIVLYTLEFDVSVQHPYGTITAQVKRWRDAGLFGAREVRRPRVGNASLLPLMGAAVCLCVQEKSVEAQTIDRAAAEVAFEW